MEVIGYQPLNDGLNLRIWTTEDSICMLCIIYNLSYFTQVYLPLCRRHPSFPETGRVPDFRVQ